MCAYFDSIISPKTEWAHSIHILCSSQGASFWSLGLTTFGLQLAVIAKYHMLTQQCPHTGNSNVLIYVPRRMKESP